MNLVNVIRKARKIYRDDNNPIEAIMSIRTTTGVGLKAAKDFWDWMGYFNDMSATKLAEWWCKDHWRPIGNCGCAVKKELAETNAAGAGASSGQPATDNPKGVPAKKDSPAASGMDSKALIKCKADERTAPTSSTRT